MRWYISKKLKNAGAHAVWRGWDDAYHTQCGTYLGDKLPGRKGGWTVLGTNPGPDVKRCPRCVRSLIVQDERAKKNKIWFKKQREKAKREKMAETARKKRLINKARKLVVEETQKLFPEKPSKRLVKNAVKIVRELIVEETKIYQGEEGEGNSRA
jgi:hypothetical protein